MHEIAFEYYKKIKTSLIEYIFLWTNYYYGNSFETSLVISF